MVEALKLMGINLVIYLLIFGAVWGLASWIQRRQRSREPRGGGAIDAKSFVQKNYGGAPNIYTSTRVSPGARGILFVKLSVFYEKVAKTTL
jgi:hypothetical protein